MDIVVEVPKGSFVKRTPGGVVDFVAPLPSPFNYGSVPSLPAPDGKPCVMRLLVALADFLFNEFII